ncbi:methyl-accepting chemotaxis protein [Maridesulfovibrio zosterae]|uniref:methyl-accepting chemotaxis protein n=1 Tax=Maridesulfovibrio zosterae TaxID=82171 RepID=UPI00041EEBD1|nr:methyl-accepting chemotaxis protein [Maridesulfovibrio zosterae]
MKVFERMNIREQILIPVLGIVILCIVGLQVFTYLESTKILEKEIVQAIIRDQKAAVRSVDSWFNFVKGTLVDWSQQREFIQTLEGDKAARAIVEKRAAVSVKNFPELRDIEVVNISGLIVAGTSPDDKIINVSQRQYFKDALNGKTTVSDPIISMRDKKPIIIISTPIRKESGDVIGVLFAAVSFKNLYQNSLSPIKIGKSGYAFAVDSKGMIVGHPDSSVVMKIDINDMPYGKDMLSKDHGIYKYFHEPQQTWKILAYGEAKVPRWHIAVIAPIGELLAPLKTMRNLTIMGAAAVIFAVAGVVFWVVRKITITLGSVVEYADEVAKGHLEKTLTVQGRGEIRTLIAALQAMVINLVDMIAMSEKKTQEAEAQSEMARKATQDAEEARSSAEVAKSEGMNHAALELEGITSQVGAASSQLASQIENSRSGAEAQKSRTTETATAMEEMNASMLEVAHNASQAAEMAEKAKSEGNKSGKVVCDVVESIKTLNKETVMLQEELNSLGEQAESIGLVMGVITDIADQTNLLALNAAIEAARAGDAGRGFAVVADEVRKLAEKTVSATNEVGKAISAIQTGARRSLQRMEDTTTVVDGSTELASQAGESIELIVNIVESTSDMVRAIAAASEQQSAASEEINRSTSEVNEIAGETAESMNQASEAMNSLSEMTERLNQVIDGLKSS